MGASRSFPIWYPLSLKFWPKGLSLGHASWQDEHGMPYFLANAGMARAGRQSTSSSVRTRKLPTRVKENRIFLPLTDFGVRWNIPPPLHDNGRRLQSSRAQLDSRGRERAWTD